jgi:hypothetical protein
MRVTFEEVKYHASKSGKCPVCGKSCTRSQKFFQTINPFNKNEDGTVKNRDEIYAELKVQIVMWKQVPPFHEKCRIY